MTKHRSRKSPDRTAGTGAGAEATEGKKAVSGTGGQGSAESNDSAVEHESGYGGKKGEPRVSSDQREKVARDGSLRSESK